MQRGILQKINIFIFTNIYVDGKSRYKNFFI
jgi:hypothetical protein